MTKILHVKSESIYRHDTNKELRQIPHRFDRIDDYYF
jgi:hypothetical protein